MGMCHMGLVYAGHVQSVEMGEECRIWSEVCATWDWFMQDMFSLWRWERSIGCGQGFVPHGTGSCRTCSVCGDGREV